MRKTSPQPVLMKAPIVSADRTPCVAVHKKEPLAA